jgi:hypothetical protein
MRTTGVFADCAGLRQGARPLGANGGAHGSPMSRHSKKPPPLT